MLLAVRNMGGENEAAWRALLDDLVARGLKTPEFLIIDRAAGLEKALAALWPEVPTQRCTVHKHQPACSPDQLHEEVSADYTDMMYAATPKEMAERRSTRSFRFNRSFWRGRASVLATHHYVSPEQLIADLGERGDRSRRYLKELAPLLFAARVVKERNTNPKHSKQLQPLPAVPCNTDTTRRRYKRSCNVHACPFPRTWIARQIWSVGRPKEARAPMTIYL